MTVKGWAITAGLGAAAGAVAILMMPHNNPTRKLAAKAGRQGLFVALMLFVGIPIPGTGAWTGTLAASFLNMGFCMVFREATVSSTIWERSFTFTSGTY